jgi:transcriptional regulator with XRE-family HTH domain
MVAFLRACGIPDEQMEAWRRAWDRIAPGGHRQTRSGVGYTVIARQPDDALQSGRHELSATPRHAAGAVTSLGANSSEERSLGQVSQPSTVDEETRRRRDATERPAAAAAPAESHPEDKADNPNKGRNPVVRRRELGARLRALRAKSGLTAEEVADSLMYSLSKVSRIEGGYRSVTLRDIHDLCDLYGVTDTALREQLMELARESRQQSWWQSYDLPYSTYIGLEADAKFIKNFHSTLIPELLQTAEYARSQHEKTARQLEPDVIEQRIELIRIRQRRLAQADPSQFWAIVDEAALHRLVGGPEVMKAQLERLAEASMLPSVTIQIVPYEAGAHPAADSCFTIFQFAGSAPAVVYVDGLMGAIYLERQDDIGRYHHIFETLSETALSPDESLDLIKRIISDPKRTV